MWPPANDVSNLKRPRPLEATWITPTTGGVILRFVALTASSLLMIGSCAGVFALID